MSFVMLRVQPLFCIAFFRPFLVPCRHRAITWFKPGELCEPIGEVSDFALTYSIHEREDLISSEMVSEISQLDGIENLRLTYAPYPQVAADVVYDDAVFHEFLASLDGVNGIDFSDPAKLEKLSAKTFLAGSLELTVHIWKKSIKP